MDIDRSLPEARNNLNWKRLEELKEKLLKDDNILLAYLFGSTSKSKGHPRSDIDIAVLLRDNSWPSISRLIDSLGLGERLDIVDLSRADPLLKYKIVSTGIKLIDKGNYEKRLLLELFERIHEALDVANSYLNGSLNPSVDREVIARKLMALDEEARILRDHILNKEIDEVIEDPLLIRVLRDSLRVAIESILDICKHLVATLALGIVREYKDFPLKLSEANLMDEKLADKLADFIRLRNIIVHRYTELNYIILYSKARELIKEAIPSFKTWLSKILKEKT